MIQTRRLCIVIERCLDCDAYAEDEPTTISQLSPDEGFKIGRRPTQPGVYIHRGEKVIIKEKK